MPGLPLLVLSGPTGVGKTAAAVQLCQRLGGEIVGADSVQVYRGFDIGSSKPGAEELAGVTHHMIDVADPCDDFDAAAFAAMADQAIADVAARGRVPVVVGGTGLWIRALTRGLVELPPVDRALRQRLEARWDSLGPRKMHEELRRVDRLSAEQVHPNDRLRIVRALEVHDQTGQPLGALRAEHAMGAPRYRDLSIVLDLPQLVWKDQVRLRTEAMFAAGWVNEVRQLVDLHGSGPRALSAVGYRQLVEYLEHGDLPMAERAVLTATYAYAKRQRTWFKSDPGVAARTTPAELATADWTARIETHLSK